MSRKKMELGRSVRAYDRAKCRELLSDANPEKAIKAALKEFPVFVVRPIAKAMGIWPDTSLWRPEWTRLLGTKSDEDLAIDFSVSSQTVRRRRLELGIQAFHRKDPAVDKLKEAPTKDLSDKTIEQLMADFKVSRVAVLAELRARGLARTNARGTAIRAVIEQVVNEVPRYHGMMAEIGRSTGLSRERVRQLIAEIDRTREERSMLHDYYADTRNRRHADKHRDCVSGSGRS
jgi:hypothetical protein